MALFSNASYNTGVAITTSDTDNIVCPSGLVVTDAIYVGAGGDIVVVQQDGNTYTLVGAIAGTIIPVRAKRINQTNTTASNLVALFSV